MPDNSPRPHTAPCPDCRQIRSAYNAAARVGDRATAQEWIEAMGRHLRVAHG